MDTLEFLRAVWPVEGNGFYCIALKGLVSGFDHSVFETIEEAVKFALEQKDERDVYFACHTLKREHLWDPQEDRWRVRVQRNMRSCRELFFDLDVGVEDHKYPTQTEASNGVVKFCQATGLPIPTFVNSGRGVHVHWRLDRQLASDNGEWVSLAARLKSLAATHGVRFDSARTTDTSSVLRVPGTLNHKESPGLPVFVKWEGVETSVEAFEKLLPAVTGHVYTQAPASLGQILGSNTTKSLYEGPDPTFDELKQTCPQIARLHASRGKGAREPVWWNSIGVVKFVEDGVRYCHEISDGHADYNVAACDAKIAQWKTPPASCGLLRSACGPVHDSLCAACPHFAVGKKDTPTEAGTGSPISHTRKAFPPIAATPPQPADAPDLKIPVAPFPYTCSAAGVFVQEKDKKSGEVTISKVLDQWFYPIQRNRTETTEQQLWRAHFAHDGVRDFVVTGSELAEPTALLKALHNHGLYPGSHFPQLRAYMNAYVRELQRTAAASIQYDNLGWADNHTKFVLPSRLYIAGGKEDIPSLGRDAAETISYIKRAGTLEGQIENLHFWDHEDYLPWQFFILSGAASIIFPMTGLFGSLINMTGLSGCAKSSALETAAAFWGHPSFYGVNCVTDQGGATKGYREQRRTVLGNLPFCLDELTALVPEEIKAIALSVSQAGGRLRLKRDGGMQESKATADRSCIVMATSNDSLHGKLEIRNSAGTAGAMRVFEIAVTKPHVHTTNEADAFKYKLPDHYGHIGPKWARGVLNSYHLVEGQVREMRARLNDRITTDSSERFWSGTIASTLYTAQAWRTRGITEWRPDRLEEWVLDTQIPHSRAIISSANSDIEPQTVMDNFLQTITGQIIITTGPIGSKGIVTNAPVVPHGKIMAHTDFTGRKMWVNKFAFRQFCDGINRSASEILNELYTSGFVTSKETKRTLGAGTIHAGSRGKCFEVDLSHEASKELVETITAALDLASKRSEAPDLLQQPIGLGDSDA